MTNEQKVKHLMARAGFGITPGNYLRTINTPYLKVVRGLLQKTKIKPIKTPPYNKLSPQEYRKLSRDQKKKIRKEIQRLTVEVNHNWLQQMILEEDHALTEKMTLFWHGHFACEPKRYDFAAQYINTLRQYALGNFRDLVLAVAKDAAMIIYLNNQQNKKNNPNENFARELMELFTIGRGHYTEKDVEASARAFTGWFSNKVDGSFNFNAEQHDQGTKTFMGKTGNFDGDDIIDIILENKQTARFICRKIYRYFVHEKVEESRLESLATIFYNSNYDIAHLMQHIFESGWFYDPQYIGSKIKSPIELQVGMAKILHITFDTHNAALYIQRALGQVLLRPPNVAGWSGGKAWVDNSTLMLRLNLAAYIIQKTALQINVKSGPEEPKLKAPKQLAVTAQLTPLEKMLNGVKTNAVAVELLRFLLPNKLKNEPAFVESFSIDQDERSENIKTILSTIMSLPEFQLC
jgi:uncharacterized protein (DUF1800 family)